MAQKVRVELIDDLDGETPADETIKFSFDGKDYEIDLSDYHAKALRENLADYISSARPDRGGKATKSSSRRSDLDLTKVRSWAREQGYNVADKGRVSKNILDAYRQAS